MDSNPFFTINPSHRAFLASPSHHDHIPYPDPVPSHTGDNEHFQYATCPQCRSDRTRLIKQILEKLSLFGIFCPFCGYEDSDVSDH